jgi:predicted nucleic acid-binding protein
MNDGKYFFDTNVVIYAINRTEPEKRSRAVEILMECISKGSGVISAQVMQECMNVTYRVSPTDSKMRLSLIENILRPLYRIDTTAELIESAVGIKDRWRYSFYDSMIIAAALACGAKTLYSEDLQHGQRIENLTIVDPFK